MKILDVPQSGSLAGSTSSHNRYGQYRRTRAMPTNPNSTAQTDVRSSFATISAGWKGLTNAQRDQWNYYALANPRVDSLGQSITLTGLQMYVSVNTVLVLVGNAAVTAPPAVAVMDMPVIGVDDPSLAGPMAITIDPDPVKAGQVMVIEASPPKSAGTSFNRDFRYVVQFAAADTSPQTIQTELAAKYGTLLAGMRFFLRSYLVAISGANNGQVSAYSNVLILDVTN